MTRDGPADAASQHEAVLAFRDGRMDPAGPVPCAAVQGTTLVVEDLFYNMLMRKKVPALLAYIMVVRVVVAVSMGRTLG